MISHRSESVLAIGLALVMGCAVCAAALVMDGTTPVTLDLRDVDVRAAIESLFRGTGRNFAIQPDVMGVIPSLSFKDVPFDIALKNLVKSSGLVYRLDGNIYILSMKPQSPNGANVAPTTVVDMAVVDTTTTSESTIDKVALSNTGASEILGMMGNGSSGGYGGYGGGYGGMSGMNGGGMGGMGGGYGGMMGGMSGGYGGMMGGMSGGYGGGYGGSSYGGYGGGSYGGSGRTW